MFTVADAVDGGISDPATGAPRDPALLADVVTDTARQLVALGQATFAKEAAQLSRQLEGRDPEEAKRLLGDRSARLGGVPPMAAALDAFAQSLSDSADVRVVQAFLNKLAVALATVEAGRAF